MYDLCRLPKSSNLASVGLALLLCLASFQVMAFLPSSTSPLLTPYQNPSAPNYTYGSDATGKVGRDFLRQSSNGANYNRLMRSTADKVALTQAASKLIRTLPAIATVLTLAEIASDLGATWKLAPDGTNVLNGLINDAQCVPNAAYNATNQWCVGNGFAYGVNLPYTSVYLPKCGFVAQCYTSNGQPGTRSTPQSMTIVPSFTTRDYTDMELADAINQSSRLPKLISELDPYSDLEPALSPKKLPWGTPDVIIPKPFTTTETATRPDGTVCTKSIVNTPQENNSDPTAFNKVSSEICKVPPGTSTNPGSVTQTISSGTTTSEVTPSKDFCELHPASIGCLDIDTPVENMPKITKNITYASEGSFGGGSCPANKTMSMRGQSLTVFDWADACTKIVSYVKPIFIMMAAFIAMLIVAGVKVES